jgi:dienelactone hydrolase
MLKYLNNSDTAIIVVHEIYGINEHMRTICQRLSELKFDVICPNLLNIDQFYDYEEEEIAYYNFMDNLGFEKAASSVKIITNQIRDQYKYLFIVGFSVGATISWLCSSEKKLYDGIIGFYGSRIRNYVDDSPKCPSLLIYGSEEKSFNVKELTDVLGKKDMVEVKIFEGKHGFSDSYSKNYHEKSAGQAFDKMVEFIFVSNIRLRNDGF